MPTAHKCAGSMRCMAAGLREIEVALLRARHAAAADGRRRRRGAPCADAPGPDRDGAGAQPAKGHRRRWLPGVHKLTIPGVGQRGAFAGQCAQDAAKTWWPRCGHRRAAQRCAPGVRIEAGISTAFGCTLQGAVPEDEVSAGRGLAEAGCGRMRPVRHHRHGQPGPGAAPVQRLRADRGPGRRGPHAQHARPGPGQLPGGLTTWACAPLTVRWAAWAAAPMHPERRATW
jgi:hydroxymethylglutaryl-CoA lyase